PPPRGVPALRGGPLSPPIRQAPEGLALGRVIAIGLACLAVGVVSLLLVYALLAGPGALGGGARSGPAAPSPLPQRLFARQGQGPLRPSEGHQLEGYGWVDRDAGVARIPIEEAMKLVAEDAR